jgi:ABC-type glycerol-3-phosphate transport system permease component
MMRAACNARLIYFFASNLQIVDTYLVLVIANSAFIAPLGIWFMQGYVRAIPPQMEEAALLDATGRLGALYRIVLPAAAPGLVTVSLISFVASWNEFILALVLTSSGNMRTVPVGLASLSDGLRRAVGQHHSGRHFVDRAHPSAASAEALLARAHGWGNHGVLVVKR